MSVNEWADWIAEVNADRSELADDPETAALSEWE